ncbi:MAG: hypothetical protein QM715_00075 [Nibricoccus sp.]
MLPLLIIGLVLFVVGGFVFLVAAFRESVLWGLACLFVPVVQLFFLVIHWHEAKKGFMLQLIGLGIMVLVAIIESSTVHARR